MNFVLVLLLFGFSHVGAAASPKMLLNCSIPGGRTTGAAVAEAGHKLVLQETTTEGRVVNRPLSSKEWTSRKIKLYTGSDSGARASLEKAANGRWFFTYRSSSWNSSGFVVCSEN